MAQKVLKDLYLSSNGDRWMLCRDSAGRLVVSHHPNSTSGGAASEMDATEFLSRGEDGPEYRALRTALGALGMDGNRDQNLESLALTNAVIEHLTMSLGEAVVQRWSGLPQDVQRALFDAAADGEPARQQLAIFLHGKHGRTLDAVHSRATQEPDSLGG